MNPTDVRRGPRFLYLVLVLLLARLPAAHASEAEGAGHWEGEIQIPNAPLGVSIDLEQVGTVWTGTIDIPMQGAEGLPLIDIVIDVPDVQFTIQGVPGDPTFDGQLQNDEIRGKFRQGGAELDFWLGRDSIAQPSRPQEPKPPYPYLSEEVTFDNGTVSLAGTLTIPKGEGPFPAAVLITGSGAQDRDESLLGHKPFLVLADHLSRAGIAVLRYDDRGVGGSTGSITESTSADFAGDVVAALTFLARRTEVMADRIGLIGHSEGGMIAPLAVTLGADVAYMVLLAGPGVPITGLLSRQIERLALAEGVDSTTAAARRSLIQEAYEAIALDLPTEQLSKQLQSIGRRQLALEGAEEDVTDEELAAEVASQMETMRTPWFRFFIDYDPRVALSEVKVPVLALNGELDTQVDAGQNLKAIEKALSSNPDVTLKYLPGLNHLFQHATTGSPSEYAGIEETFAPEVLALVSSWILERFGAAEASGH